MAADKSNPVNRRRSIRFTPDLGTFAQIDVEENRADGSFQPSIMALVPEESSKGVGLVILSTSELPVGKICRVQVGKLSPLKAEVRWRQDLDAGVLRIGLLYLE